jgi:hypothetical protein
MSTRTLLLSKQDGLPSKRANVLKETVDYACFFVLYDFIYLFSKKQQIRRLFSKQVQVNRRTEIVVFSFYGGFCWKGEKWK